ncbi:MAG: hypothetical protein IPI67_26615 [Myxococcales bacterium]|nr:hypothetical protein [Myxococcales bacterium]
MLKIAFQAAAVGRSAFFLVAVLGALSCGDRAEQAPTPIQTSKSYQQALVAGVAPAPEQTTPISNVAFLEPAEQGQFKPPVSSAIASSPEAPVAVPADTDVVWLDFQSKSAFAVKVDAAGLDAVRAALASRPVSDPANSGESSDEGATASPSSKPMGWSNAYDARVNKAIGYGYPKYDPVLSKIGMFAYGGSGQLFGRRLVMTAAHVICRGGGCSWPAFSPRRDTTTCCNSTPFGSATPIAAWVGGGFLANQCHVTYNYAACAKEDWAVLLLPDTAFSGDHPGYMGFISTDEATLQSYTSKRSDGYPLCDAIYPDRPAGCVFGSAFGQTTACGIGRFHNANGSGGYKNLFAHGCDTSPGHSGSALHTFVGSSGPYILGITFWNDCDTCYGQTGDILAYPTVAVRINDWLFSYMLNKRVQYP